MIEYKTLEGDSGRHSAVSTITLRPSPEDNGVAYACQAHHHKLKPPLTTLVRLSVLCESFDLVELKVEVAVYAVRVCCFKQAEAKAKMWVNIIIKLNE